MRKPNTSSVTCGDSFSSRRSLYTKGVIIMDFYQVPIGFGLALSSNTAAMNRYAHLDEQQKQDILNKAHNVRSEEEMYALVATLANGAI